MIQVTKHAIEQYRTRILNNCLIDNKTAAEQIIDIFNSSRYVKDNQKGILFRNTDLMIEMIIRVGRIVTLFPIFKKGKKNGLICKNDR